LTGEFGDAGVGMSEERNQSPDPAEFLGIDPDDGNSLRHEIVSQAALRQKLKKFRRIA
jgi:hypothetical protein